MKIPRTGWAHLVIVILAFVCLLPAPVLASAAQQSASDQNAGAKVVQIVQEIILSGVLVYVFLAAVHFVTLLYAVFSVRRILSYLLGWLIAIFFTFFITVSTGKLEPVASSAIFGAIRPLLATELVLTVIAPAIAGLVGGYVMMELLRRRTSQRLRMIIVMLLTATTVLAYIGLAISSLLVRNVIASTTFAFTIGSLLYTVVNLQVNWRLWRTSRKEEQTQDTW